MSGKIAVGFTAWDGYSFGRTLPLEPYQRIVQAWRTSEVPDEAPDSRLEALLEKVKNGKTGTLTHTGFPPGSASSCKQGWKDFYIIPMNEHFGKVTDLQEF